MIPKFALVALVGTTGSGKSTFARKHFLPTEILSSDAFRGMVSDDENAQDATDDAFAALHFVAAKRLARMKTVVVDATNVQPEARKPLIQLAREYHALPVALVLDIPERVCIERNRERPDRAFGTHVVVRQHNTLRRSLRGLEREGFRRVHILRGEAEVLQAVVEREPLWNDRRTDHGPFDIVGDVHGCFDELAALLVQLGYHVEGDTFEVVPPQGRKLVFLGDLVDRGPNAVGVLKIAMNMVASGAPATTTSS
jgi:predicted kinase